MKQVLSVNLRTGSNFGLSYFTGRIRRFWKNISFALAAFILTISLASCTNNFSTSDPPLRVGTIFWPGYDTLYLARDLGFYNRKPIELINYPSSQEMITAFEKDEVDAVTVTIFDALILAEKTPNIHVGLVLDVSNGGDAVIAKSMIYSLKDIKYKKVGLEDSGLASYMLSKSLEKASLKIEDVNPISLPYSEHEASLKAGKVDAIVTFEPARTKLLGSGANKLFDSTQIPGEIIDVLVFNDNALKNKQSTSQSLVDGYFKGIDYMRKNIGDATKRLAARAEVSQEEFLQSLNSMDIPSVWSNKNLLTQEDRAFSKKLESISEYMQKSKLLKKSLDPTSLLNSSLVEKTKAS
jgi:NitT/TauT family transport system substrate-binding protein